MAEHEEHGGGEEHGESHGGGGHGGGHGGAHEEHEGAPEWLISFADNVALLMGFFVILLAMNMAKQTAGGIGGEKEMGGSTDPMMEFVIAVREGFNSPVSLQSKRPEDQAIIRYLLQREGGPATQNAPQGRFPTVGSVRTPNITRPAITVNFDDRQAILSQDAKQDIADIAAKTLRDRNWIVEVRGHVSPSEAMRNPQRAYELGYQRAMAVAQELSLNGVKWDLMRIVSCGDAQRIEPRAADRESDRTNQRVEVIQTEEPGGDDPYAKPASESDPSADSHADAGG